MIEWILTSSVLILLMILLRVLIKNRINPRLRYALWGLVLLRLLVPVSLWESPASVMAPVAVQEVYQDIERIPRYVRERPDGWVEIGHPTRGNWTSISPESETVRTDKPCIYQWFDAEEAVSLTELKRQVSVRDAFLWVWLAGAAVVGAFLLAVNLRFSRKLHKTRRTLAQYRGRWAFTVEGLATPCLFGLSRPGIYLTPEVAEDEAAREHVLAHEYAHFSQGDHVWAVLRGVCLAVHWYNPLVWLAAYLSRRDCELSCDEGAVRLLGEDCRADYGRTLVGLVAHRTTPRDLACCATTMTGGKSALKERIALLVKRPRTTAWMACIVAAACIVFAVCTFTGAAEEEPEPAPDEPDAPVEVLPVDDEDLPNIENLPTDWDWDTPIWLLDKTERPDIYLYQDRETSVNYLRYGEHIQKLETHNMYDQQGYNDMDMYFRDLDGDGADELAIVYHVTAASGKQGRTVLVCEWDGQRWTEHPVAPIVSSLVQDFQENHQVSELWVDPDMGEDPKPSYLSVSWNGTAAAVEVNSWVLKTGGSVECVLDGEQYDYSVGPNGIELMIPGEARYADSPVQGGAPLRYSGHVSYRADGTFVFENGALNSDPPEDLPTELMDLSRPAEEQGPWLLLAKCRWYDVALYRSARDDQHVYIRATNGSFQRFDRDLSGMELLPTMEDLDSDTGLVVQVLYRRYEGTYFDGTAYEPGIVAEPVAYVMTSLGRYGEKEYWTEERISTQPAQLRTEDLPAIADLPTRLVSPGTPEAEADMWLIGELRSEDIAVYWEQSTGKYWLRYGRTIRVVEGVAVCMPQMLLPELHFADLDEDGDRELAIISTQDSGTGVAREMLTVYEWEGDEWTGYTYDSDWLVNGFNYYLIYQFYDDGTAFVWNTFCEIDLLLDLSELWESGYWDSPPDFCGLSDMLLNFTCQDGVLALTVGGEFLETDGNFLHGYVFDYVCPVVYKDDRFDYFSSWNGVLRSDYTVEPERPVLTDAWRKVLRKTLAECSTDYPNAYAVYDVTGDGEDDLIVYWMPEGGIGSALGTSVYNAYGKELSHGYGKPTFLDNGFVSWRWYRNPGKAIGVWPYSLGQWTTDTNGNKPVQKYTYIGSARIRSSDVPGFEEVAYADLDGDGAVYYIDSDLYDEENETPVDNAVYEAWVDRYLRGAKVLPVRYWPLTEEAIS